MLQLLIVSIPSLLCVLYTVLLQPRLLPALSLLLPFVMLGTFLLISSTRVSVLKRGIFGKDINKIGQPDCDRPVPESQGLAAACAHVVGLFLIPIGVGLGGEEAAMVYASFFVVLFNLLIGFYDDVLEIRWRYKAFLSMLCAVPAGMLLPGCRLVIPWLDFSLNLGVLLPIFMAMMSTFVPNSINIYAGINGL
jgi:UDP-N-acetylglucosamine--dolichyl-phosphate N-acetylglucosaminephosphotransferase